MKPPLWVLVALLVSGAVLVGVELGKGALDEPSPKIADPCQPRAGRTGGIDTTIQRIVLDGLDGAACRLHTTREELVLSLGGSGLGGTRRWDSHTIEVALREFLLLVIEARVSVLSDYLFEKVEPNIRAAILDRFSFERRELGQDALVSEVMATIQNVKGVAYVDIDKFDWIDEKKVVDHLGGGKPLGEIIGRNERIPVALARVNSDEPPGRRIKPAQLAYFSPTIPDTIILSEITS